MSPQVLTQAAYALRPSSNFMPISHDTSCVTLNDSHVTNNDSHVTSESSDEDEEEAESEMSRSDVLKLLQRRKQKSPLTKTTPPVSKPQPKKPRLALRSEFLESDSDSSPELKQNGDKEEKHFETGHDVENRRRRKKPFFGVDSDDEEEEEKEDGSNDGGEVERNDEEEEEMGRSLEEGRNTSVEEEESEDEHSLAIVE